MIPSKAAPTTCDGSGTKSWLLNPPDPQTAVDAPCEGCIECEPHTEPTAEDYDAYSLIFTRPTKSARTAETAGRMDTRRNP